MRCPSLSDLPSPPQDKAGWPWTEASPQLPDTLPNGKPWPRITIVTPSYNQARYLEETLRSVLLQGYPNLEYIVLDGGSADGSVEIIRKYEPWLAYWRSERDEGQSAAIAEGFERATGEILAWLNSDDRYQINALGRVGSFFATHPRVVFLNSDLHAIDAESRFTHRHFVAKPLRVLAINLGYHTWPQPGCYWRRSAYEKAGGVDPSLRFCMDRDLFIRLVAVGQSARLRGTATADMRNHSESKSSTLLDVAAQESTLLSQRYSSMFWRNFPLYRQFLRITLRGSLAWRSLRRRFASIGIEI
ncbi:MAG: glycosyltransferase [Chloroflexales bacterium]|nr:glycosyltransferase [Chloroflexales bacterium]